MSEHLFLESVLDEHREFTPSQRFSENAHIKCIENCGKKFAERMKDPEGFWATELHWADGTAIGNVATLADPTVLEALKAHYEED